MPRLFAVLLCIAVSPAAASTWLVGDMSDAGPHPRTCLVPDENDTVLARLGREPYRTQVARLVTLSGVEADLDDHEPYTELSKANAARAAAWLFFMDRTVDGSGDVVPFEDEAARDAMGEIAVTYLLAMYTESRADGLIDFIEDIFTAQELHLWAEALDLLLGADRDILGDERETVIQNVADLAADFYADHAIDNWILCRTLVNNHRTKSVAALGLAAIALNGETFAAAHDDGRYDPALWIDFAVRNTDFTLRDILTDPDGGYQEAGSYLGYSAIDHAAFLWAWHRYTGGASYEMTWDDPVSPYYVLGAVEPYTVPDMWSDEVIEATLLWGVRTQLPDGTFPPFDDCTPGSRLFYGAFVGEDFDHAGLFRWSWELGGQAAGGSTDVAPLILAAYDDTIVPTSPDEVGLDRHQVMPYAGQVIFRSSWDTDAVYAAMLCEHGRAAAVSQTRWGQFIDGAGGHEHPDGSSVMLYAHGEALIIDSGYLGWDDHTKVWAPQNHNLILVDGEGPALPVLSVPPFAEGSDGELTLSDFSVEGGWTAAGDGMTYLTAADAESDGIAFAQAVTGYHHLTPTTEVQRRMALLADQFVVLHDHVWVDDHDSHALTHTLHTHCGGTSGGVFESTDHGGTCTRDGARLAVAVLSPDVVSRTTREDVHDEYHWVELTHTVVETTVQTEGARPVEFLSVLPVEPSVDGAYDAVDLTVGECGDTCAAWSRDGLACEAWAAHMRDVLGPDGVAVVEAEAGAYCADDAALAGWFAGTPDDPAALLVLRVEFDDRGSASHWRAAVLNRTEGPELLRLVLPLVEDSQPDGACAWANDVASAWTVQVAAPAVVETSAQARAIVANLRLESVSLAEPAVVPLGTAALLDGTATCSALNTPLEYSWALETRPEISEAVLPAVAGAELTFEPDLPGLYRVALTVSSEGYEDRAVLAFEVEGESVIGDDDDSAAGGDDDDASGPGDAAAVAVLNRNPDGCDCALSPTATPGLAPMLILLAATWRRRAGR